MKSESLVFVVALLFIGIIILKNFGSIGANNTKQQIENITENNIQNQNILEDNQNTISNFVDISAIEELRQEENN